MIFKKIFVQNMRHTSSLSATLVVKRSERYLLNSRTHI